MTNALLLPDGRVIVTEPRRCASCGTMHYYFVNAAGKTRCVGCDEKEVGL